MNNIYTAEANGKVILFGEHFVVHNIPAIAGSIENVAIVDVEPQEEKTEFNTRIEGTIPELTSRAIEYVKQAIGTEQHYKIYLRGNLPTFGGLGSSAAFCVALARAIAKAEEKEYSNERINKIAYEGEKAFHGNPSGIDNTLANYGGIKKFIRGKTPAENVFQDVPIKYQMNIVISYSGKLSKTAKMVANVQTYKEKHPQEFDEMCRKETSIINEAEKALLDKSLNTLGELMNGNHELLRELGVSYSVNETVISHLLDAGALGAKLTGGGGGGTNIGLFKNENDAKKAVGILRDEGYATFHTKVPYLKNK